MRQRETRTVLAYWDALRGSRPAPLRSELDPGAIRSCLAHTFILTVDCASGHPFRIAGTSICEWFGIELVRTPFARLFDTASQPALNDAVRTVTSGITPFIAHIAGASDRHNTDLEMLLLPLCGSGGQADRMLGVLTPLQPPYWLGSHPLRALSMVRTGADRHEAKTSGGWSAPAGSLVLDRAVRPGRFSQNNHG